MPAFPKRSRSPDAEQTPAKRPAQMNSATPSYDSSPVPDGWTLAVVIPPRVTKTETDVDGETKTDKAGIGPSDTSRPQSVAASAKSSALTTEARKDLLKKDEQYRMLMLSRFNVQKVVKELEKETTLTFTHVDALKKVIDTLALHTFPDHDKVPWLLKSTKILMVLEKLTDATTFSDEVADPAKCLRKRWEEGDYEPRPIVTGDEIDSEHDSGAGNPEHNSSEAETDELIKQLMRGVRRTAKSMKLEEDYPQKRSADIFGNNGLSVGDWWPYQLCALRDGAHGSTQAGVYGKIVEGVYSIVISADSPYDDDDEGYKLTYTGTLGEVAGDKNDSTRRLMTDSTRRLMASINKRPVRVLRRGDPNIRKKWYPRCGLRYDGLYLVKDAKRVGKNYEFSLERVSGQRSLEQVSGIPDRNHKLAWGKLTGFF